MREYKKLMEDHDPPKLYRSQGSVGIIDLLKSIPADCRRYLKDVATGKIKPLKEG